MKETPFDLTAPAEKMTARLASLGWEVLAEEDAPDFKDYYCRHPEGLLGAFTVMSLVLMPGVLEDAKKVLDLRLILWADPARISDKRTFGKKAREEDCRAFRELSADLLNAAGLEPGDVWHVEVRHLAKGRTTILFQGHKPVPPSYEATIFQWGTVGEL
jgi:hypothetical protein